MIDPDLDARPGYGRMIRAFSASRAILTIITGIMVLGVLGSAIRGRDLENLLGNAWFFALIALVLWAGFREERRTHVADSAHLRGATLDLVCPRWSGQVTPDQVRKVRQLRRNPFNPRAWLPSREWRYWISVVLRAGADPGAQTVYVWSDRPIALLDDLERAGFPVRGGRQEPGAPA